MRRQYRAEEDGKMLVVEVDVSLYRAHRWERRTPVTDRVRERVKEGWSLFVADRVEHLLRCRVVWVFWDSLPLRILRGTVV